MAKMNSLELFLPKKAPFLKLITQRHTYYIVVFLRTLVFLTLTYLKIENIDAIARMKSVKSSPSTANF